MLHKADSTSLPTQSTGPWQARLLSLVPFPHDWSQLLHAPQLDQTPAEESPRNYPRGSFRCAVKAGKVLCIRTPTTPTTHVCTDWARSLRACMSVCLSVCLSVRLRACLSVCLTMVRGHEPGLASGLGLHTTDYIPNIVT